MSAIPATKGFAFVSIRSFDLALPNEVVVIGYVGLDEADFEKTFDVVVGLSDLKLIFHSCFCFHSLIVLCVESLVNSPCAALSTGYSKSL